MNALSPMFGKPSLPPLLLLLLLLLLLSGGLLEERMRPAARVTADAKFIMRPTNASVWGDWSAYKDTPMIRKMERQVALFLLHLLLFLEATPAAPLSSRYQKD